MYILSLNMWFQKLIKQFFFAIDKIVFGFISDVYDLLITIARTSPLSQADILDMADRIYKLLAIFMIFKVTFSLIMYVVNPDDFSDKSKGLSKLVTNIIISLSMLILTPYIFNYAYQLQTIVLEDNSLGTLIFGEKSNKQFLNTAGDNMAYLTMSPFFVPNLSLDELSECVTLIDNSSDSSDKIVNFNEECFGLENETLSPIDSDTNSLYGLTKSTDVQNFDLMMLQNYAVGIQRNNLGLLFRQDIALATYNNEQFIIDYKIIFSTVIGVVVLLLLLTFCMDIALRSIKLAFLQLIAPIPILSYVDPKSGKDGMFKKWYQMCFKTYLSLFIRLLALYFAVYIISLVADMRLVDIVDGTFQTNGFVAIFIIIGALMFAKQFPKILEGLGIKLDGDGKFTLNPLKKLGDEAVGGKLLKGVGVAAGGAALVGGASMLTGKGLRGTGTAMRKAISGGIKGEKFGKNFSSSYAAGLARKQEVQKMENDGVSPGRVSLENFKNKFVGMTAKDELDDFNASIKTVQDNYKSYYNGILGADKIAKEFDRYRIAAENSGDQAAMKLWQDAIDARVKQVQKNGGKIALAANSSDIAQAIASARTGAYDETLSYSSETVDKGLVNIKVNNDKIIQHINDNYNGRFDYSGELSASDDFKTINGKTKSVERAASSSQESREISDLYKYVDTKSKK